MAANDLISRSKLKEVLMADFQLMSELFPSEFCDIVMDDIDDVPTILMHNRLF